MASRSDWVDSTEQEWQYELLPAADDEIHRHSNYAACKRMLRQGLERMACMDRMYSCRPVPRRSWHSKVGVRCLRVARILAFEERYTDLSLASRKDFALTV